MELKKNIEKLPDSAVKLTLTVAQSSVQSAYDELVIKYTRTAQVKGFRKGKVPRQVLERKFGPSLRAEALQEIIESSLEETLQNIEERPLPYARPTLVDEDLELDFDKDLTFSVTYDVFPEVTPGTAKGLTVTEPKVKITKADEDAELEELRQKNSLVVDKESGAVAAGDIVTLTISELDDDGKALEETRQENYQVVVGQQNYYGIDAEIIGLSQGESTVIEKSYDDEHDVQALRGRSVKLGASVVQIKMRDVPDLDDEFAQDVSDEFKTLQDLRKDVRKRLEKTATERVRAMKIDDLMKQLLESSTVSVPASMVDTELESSWRGMAEQYRISPEQLQQLLEMQGRTREQIIEEWRPAATERLKRSLIVQELIKQEEITVDEEAAIARIREDAEERNADADRIVEYYRSNNMLSYVQQELTERKLFDNLLEASTIKAGAAVKYVDLIKENE